MKISKEFKIGIVVTLALALLYWGLNFLKGEDIFSKERVFLSVYKDVGGLQKANPVRINGLIVGQVRDMFFSGDGDADIVIELVIRNKIAIPDNSTAKIISSDILGSKAVDIILGTSSQLAESGDTLQAEIEESIKDEVSRQLKPIKSKAENLMLSIDTVLTMLNNLFSTTNTENISRSVGYLANTFENLESTTSTLDTIMSGQKTRLERILLNIESITLTLKSNEDNLNSIFTNLAAVSDTLAKAHIAETISNVNRVMSEIGGITEKINKGEGSLGMLVNNDSLYIKLEKTTRELNLLIEDIRLNPKKYLKFSVF